MNTCSKCHWWFMESICVWHNGTKKTDIAKIRFRGTLTTNAEFGCVDWQEDKREKGGAK